MKWALLLWTAAMGWWLLSGLYDQGVSYSDAELIALNSGSHFDTFTKAAYGIGMFTHMVIVFVVWLIGAVPIYLIGRMFRN